MWGSGARVGDLIGGWDEGLGERLGEGDWGSTQHSGLRDDLESPVNHTSMESH